MNGLKEKRTALGLTQAELAKAVGVSQSVISILEREDIEAGKKLSDALDKALGKPNTLRLIPTYTFTVKNGTGKKMTQTDRVLEFMRQHGSISQQEAINAFSCYRLAAKIFDLRKDGYTIKTEKVPFSNGYTSGFYAVYKLIEADE